MAAVERWQLIVEQLRDKSILLLGFGQEGASSYHFIRRHLPKAEMAIADFYPLDFNRHPYLKDDENLCFFTGKLYLESLNRYQVIIKSPGVSLKHINTGALPGRLTGQTELFLSAYADCTVGITGTKGKSTTASLIHHILRECNHPAVLAGNIGIPLFDVMEDLPAAATVVAELSSHQLEYCTHSPHVAVLLNIHPEHLDHYLGFDQYRNAKLNICRHQRRDDFLVYNATDDNLVPFIPAPAAFTGVPVTPALAEEQYEHLHTFLMGRHNLYNIACALAVTALLNVDQSEAKKAVSSFQGLPHRLEYVGRRQGIDFYNDSISTIPQATIMALESVPGVKTLILGGMDRGVDLSPLVEHLKTQPVPNVLLVYETGEILTGMLKNLPIKVHFCQDLASAVGVAFKVTPADNACLLSPAAASYGHFKNFAERGDYFRQAVLSHQP